MSKAKCKTRKKKLLIVISVVLALGIIIAGANLFMLDNLLKKGNSYNAVETKNQLIPQKDKNGYWYFTTDDDFKVMHLTDIHIGGGFLSKDVDEKALNAIALMVTKEKQTLLLQQAISPSLFPTQQVHSTTTQVQRHSVILWIALVFIGLLPSAITIQRLIHILTEKLFQKFTLQTNSNIAYSSQVPRMLTAMATILLR